MSLAHVQLLIINDLLSKERRRFRPVVHAGGVETWCTCSLVWLHVAYCGGFPRRVGLVVALAELVRITVVFGILAGIKGDTVSLRVSRNSQVLLLFL